MEYGEKKSDNTPNQLTKYRSKKWVGINDGI